MRCAAYCMANSHKLVDIKKDFEKNYSLKLYLNAIHISLSEKQEVFIIYGSVIFWDMTPDEENEWLHLLKPYAKELIAQPESDIYEFQFGGNNHVHEGLITIKEDNAPLSMLAVSFGLAQSVKLSVYEKQIDDTIVQAEYLPTQLAREGKIPLSRLELSKQIGRLFLARSSINLYSDILDIPDFFWDYPELERIYKMTISDVDLKYRTDVVNRRLDIMHQLFDMLSNALNSKHSAHLEWIIIWLIVMEVVMSIIHLINA